MWVGQPGYTNNSYESIKSSGYIENIPEYLKIELKEYYDMQNYSVNITDKLNNQYRTRLDEFTKTYSPIIADFGETRNYAYLEDVSWQDINPKHFNPRVKAVFDSKHELWSLFLDELRIMKQKSRNLLKNIDKYLND